jgi:hypothetical protein
MPLLITAVGCTAIAVALRLSATTVVVGRMEIWGLFVALAIIAGIGAAASMLVDDPAMAAYSTLATPRSGAVPVTASARPRARPERPTVAAGPLRRPEPSGGVAQTSAAIWAELEPESGSSVEPDNDLPPVSPRRSSGSMAPRPGEVSPAEAIAEIDGLWSDLERLRHTHRRSSAV